MSNIKICGVCEFVSLNGGPFHSYGIDKDEFNYIKISLIKDHGAEITLCPRHKKMRDEILEKAQGGRYGKPINRACDCGHFKNDH